VSTTRIRVLAATVTAGLMFAATDPLSAHPTALTHALVVVHADRTIDVTFTTSGAPLVAKLEALDRRPPASPETPAEIEAKLIELSGVLAARIDVRADAARVGLHLAGVSAVAGESGKFAVRLTGRVPADATTLSWASSLVAGTYPLAVRREGTGGPTTDDGFEWLTGAETSRAYDLRALAGGSRWGRFLQAIAIGFAHIVPKGRDHVLFVLGLVLLSARTRTVLMQVTAFTMAHSVTLALGIHGLVAVPASVVEPLIALSIVYVALENIFATALTPWRLALVFGFGLLHGLGFAEALMALDLPRGEFLSTLVGFNIGVEAGQLAVIVAAALAVAALRLPATEHRRLVVRPASAAIAIAGVYWAVERVL
jgi:hypothetical protein